MTPTHIVVGAGQAGSHAAMAMRAAGFTGRILLIGEEPHLPYERPPLSKDVLTAIDEPAVAWFHPEARYGERGIEFLPATRVTEIDPAAQRVTLADGRRLGYDKLLLATGARARTLTLPGAHHALYLRTLDDARAIRARLPTPALSLSPPGHPAHNLPNHVVCIGAGVIGLELASSLHARGCTVTVLEAGPGAMGRSLTAPFARHIESLHRAAGVTLLFGAEIQAIEPGAVLGQTAAGRPFRIPAATVIAGIGVIRNDELAHSAGLATDRGILVDQHGQTSNETIYAAGDVAAFWHPILNRRLRLEAWRHAQNHGIATGRAMAGNPEPYTDTPWFWTDQHNTNLQVAGLPENAATTIMRGHLTDPSCTAFHLDPTGRITGAEALNAPREIRAALGLIRSGAIVDPTLLADPAVPAQKLR